MSKIVAGRAALEWLPWGSAIGHSPHTQVDLRRDFISGVGGDPTPEQTAAGEVGPVSQSPAEAREVQFVTFVVDTSEATWAQILPAQTGVQWHNAKLDLFRDAIATGCGTGQTAMGPFYVNSDTFTHGSAEQRASWFRKGFASGNVKDCNTFAGM